MGQILHLKRSVQLYSISYPEFIRHTFCFQPVLKPDCSKSTFFLVGRSDQEPRIEAVKMSRPPLRWKVIFQKHVGGNPGKEQRSIPWRRGTQKRWVGCAAHFPKPLLYLLPKSANFQCPIYDMTKNSIPFATVTVALNISYEELLLIILHAIMMK